MKGTWGLEQRGEDVLITMRFDYTPRRPWIIGWRIHRAIKRSFQPIVDELLDNWEAEIMNRQVLETA